MFCSLTHFLMHRNNIDSNLSFVAVGAVVMEDPAANACLQFLMMLVIHHECFSAPYAPS